MKYLVRTTFFAILLTSIFTACSEQPSEKTSISKEDLIDAVEANAELAPAEAIENMKQEVKETADEITEEIPLVVNEQSADPE